MYLTNGKSSSYVIKIERSLFADIPYQHLDHSAKNHFKSKANLASILG